MSLQIVTAIAGILFIGGLGICLGLLGVMNFRDWLDTRRDKVFNAAMERAAEQLGHRMIQDSHWMSEYPQVYLFMELYGTAYRDNINSGIEQVRAAFKEKVK